MRRINRHRRRKQAERKAFGIFACVVFLLACSLIFCITGISVEEYGRIGNVEFSVTEPLGDKLYSDGSTIRVEPGQRLAKDPTLTMEKGSKPAYIRARILFGGLDAAKRRELEKGLSLKTGWVYQALDGYYYYQYPVEAGESVCFFDALTVPESWGDSQSELCFCMEVQMEAAEIGCIKIIYDTGQKISGWTKIS